MTSVPKIAFDVDGTLIYDEHAKPIELCDTPRYDVIAVFKALEALGCDMYIWSGGGIEYAERWRDKLGLLNAKVVGKGSFKPDIAFDDMDLDFRAVENSLGLVNIQV